MKKERGSLTIEASFSLVFFIIIMLTFMTFARLTTIQNKVKHSLNQAAITLSARNVVLCNIGANMKYILGKNFTDFDTLLKKFDESNIKDPDGKAEGDFRTVVASWGAPYSDGTWGDDDLRYEVLKSFVAQYFCISYEDVEDNATLQNALKEYKSTYNVSSLKGLSRSQKEAILTEVLKQTGLKEFKVEGGHEGGKFISEATKEDKAKYNVHKCKILSVKITYKIDVPFSFAEKLGSTAEPEFIDSVSIALLK